MYQEFPHQPIERDEEIVCARCGLINPGEDDTCISVPSESSQEHPLPKVA